MRGNLVEVFDALQDEINHARLYDPLSPAEWAEALQKFRELRAQLDNAVDPWKGIKSD